MFVSRWTVDYGDGPRPVVVPHAWAQEVSVEWEGPAVYRTAIDVPRGGGTLRFWGVSYAAEVFANGTSAAHHRGIWDAFDVPLPGGRVELEVRVVKNGGATYPVETVASGGLPRLFNAFGGIYREVELLEPESPRPTDARVEGAERRKRPYLRGLLHRGWYPELGHPNPDDHTIRREVRVARSLGFNLVKFDGWVPPHRYLDILREEGMLAWLDLPTWTPNAGRLDDLTDEIERIVLQYRHHPSLIVWTVGLGPSWPVSDAFRRELVAMVRALVGDGEVVERSDGVGRDYGAFEALHPLCDLPFYPVVLDELRDGQRYPVLGESADADVHRDLARLGDELPFWASALPELNAQGTRERNDLPRVLDASRFALEPTRSRHKALMDSSRRKALFVRKTAIEAVRARPDFDGYVVEGWRDTPISSSGFFDDWGNPRFSPEECRPWNGGGVLFPMPEKRLVWAGGHRSGWLDPLTHFAGDLTLRLGADGDAAGEGFEVGVLTWRIVGSDGVTRARGSGPSERGRQLERARVVWEGAAPGEYRLSARCGGMVNEWPLWVVERPAWEAQAGWGLHDPAGLLPELAQLPGGDRTIAVRRAKGERGVLLLDEEGTLPMPFWRECAQEFADPALEHWERLLPVSPDRALDPAWLREKFGTYEVLINRIDTRTYAEHPLLVRAGDWIVTTFRPYGGLGSQPPSLALNPAGCALLEALMRSL